MGVTAATNEAVDKARWEMNFAIFGALLVMCMITFRSLRATLCILIPLALVSILCEALMPMLGIGLKVSTLPVIALGVGVGVDYGIYLYDRIEIHLEEGKPLHAAFFEALNERGTAMVFTAVTMTIGVGTWALSALKFQADMGILLAFMFFLNMLGALFLLPALAAFLLKPHPAPKPSAPAHAAAMLIYGELAEWWPLFSHPKEYREEAEWIWAALAQSAKGPVASILELGSGGGNSASHLKRRCTLTLTDISPQMLAVSRALNPECEHIEGDMRAMRLGRTFDAVYIHDAIMYMATRADLLAALATAAEHLAPGGIAVVQPDFVAETFRPTTDHGGHDGADGRGVRYLEWTREASPGKCVVEVDYALVLRTPDGATRIVHERHSVGIFARKAWRAAFRDAGFANVGVEADPWEREVFFAIRG